MPGVANIVCRIHDEEFRNTAIRKSADLKAEVKVKRALHFPFQFSSVYTTAR